MFKSIFESWKKTESTELRKEFIDMIEHVQTRSLTGDPMLAKFISRLIYNLNKEHGQDVFSLSEKERKKIVKMLIKKAREIGREQFIPAAGMSFVAFAIKASYLSGEDADFVKVHCGEIINTVTTE